MIALFLLLSDTRPTHTVQWDTREVHDEVRNQNRSNWST